MYAANVKRREAEVFVRKIVTNASWAVRMILMSNTNTLQARYEAAATAIKVAEAKNRGARTMAKLYKALFLVEDEAKLAGAL